MLTGLRASDAATLIRLCEGDQKVFLRLGAMLQAKLAFTEAALGDLLASERGKSLVMDRRLRDADSTAFQAVLSESQLAAELTMVVDAAQVEAGWRIIALLDEVGNPLLAAAAPPAAGEAPRSAGATLALRVASLSPSIRVPVEGLLQAAGDEQRAAALEQLRYAGPPLDVVGELMPLLLADAAELVRERAINLLVSSGAHVTVIDLVRALQRDDLQGLSRLGPMIAPLPDLQAGLACSALMAAVGRGQHSQVLIEVCYELSLHLARHPALDRLIELLLPTTANLVHLVRGLQLHDADRVRTILANALGQGPESDRHIIILLAGPNQQGDETLLERGLDLLLSTGPQPTERMSLSIALQRLDAERTLARRITTRGMGIAKAYDTCVYWTLSELARAGAIDLATGTDLARLIRRLLREASGPHLVAILEYQLVALLPAPDEDRAALIEPLLESLNRYRDERTRDLVMTGTLAIGTPAIDPLWQALTEHSHAQIRCLAADLLPELLASADGPTLVRATARVLARIELLDRADGPDELRSLITAAARLATMPGLDTDPAPTLAVDAVCRNSGDAATDALGWIAASRHLDPVRRSAILDDFLSGVTEEIPDAPMERHTDQTTDIATFVIDPQLGRHTERVPRLLTALERMGKSPYLPAPLLRHLVDRLCDQWKLVASWKVVWGPGNTIELGRVLAGLAQGAEFPGPLRLKVAEAMMLHVSQITIARHLPRIFALGEGPALSDLAGRACDRLMALAGRNQFADDEEADLADVLVDFLAVPHLGSQGDALRRRIAGQLTSLRTKVTNRARAQLRGLLPTLDPSVVQRLDWA